MMPDITLCTGEECPFKLDCYRFVAPPDKWQSQMSPQYDPNSKSCLYYWTLEDAEIKNERKEY